MTLLLPSSCERAILEQFLKAEAMALWAVRSAQAQDVPPGELQFLRRHEEEEAQHLKQFELLLGMSSHGKTALPRMPSQCRILVVYLYGYETLVSMIADTLSTLTTRASVTLDRALGRRHRVRIGRSQQPDWRGLFPTSSKMA